MSLENIPPFPDDLPVAEITSVDFQKLLAGDVREAEAVYEAATGYGFFYMSNHPVDSSTMFGLAKQVFDLPMEEKMKYDMGTTGHYFGYKRPGHFMGRTGRRDQTQFYNISKNDMLSIDKPRSTDYPDVLNASHESVAEFMKASHKVVDAVLQALGQQLGMDKEVLPSMHRIDEPSACQTRLTHANPLTSGDASINEHTDFGSVTVLFNRLGGLQVLRPNSKEWMYVKPRPGSAIINLGDALVKFTGGRLYSGLHRVVGPPGDQAKLERHSVVYFCRPNSGIKLRSLFPEDKEDEESAMYSDDWITQRAKSLAVANKKDPKSREFITGTAHNVTQRGNPVTTAV